MSLRRAALTALMRSDPSAKLDAVRLLAIATDDVDPDEQIDPPVIDPAAADADVRIPGRPAKPRLVHPARLATRSVGSAQGRAALIHALAHIEFNAINLALDLVWRFAGMPPDFYRDWAGVAAEEALHFDLLVAHLRTLGFDYGDFDAHDGLWEMAEATRDDLLARIALVPRILEARGLDVAPVIARRLAEVGDAAAAAILQVIERDEIGHVATGNRWYGWLCQAAGVDPIETQRTLAVRHRAPAVRGPLNRSARVAAGFTEAELDALEQIDKKT